MSTNLFSVVNVYKPAGMTSHDVVTQCRRVFNTQKVGHLGTLDPVALGVLPIALGKATRLIEYFPDDKVYEATIELGRETDTLDSEGVVITQAPVPELDYELVWHTLPQFMGVIQQQVPRYSAVHYKGKKLYHYVRSGVIIPDDELPVKEVTIHDMTLLSVDLEADTPLIKIRAHCSSGTYMRSLARDLAKALGTVGHLRFLERTQHGHFTKETAVELATLIEAENPALYLQNPLDTLPQKQVFLTPDALAGMINGMTVACPPLNDRMTNNTQVLARSKDVLGAMAVKVGHRLKPEKVMNAPLKQPAVLPKAQPRPPRFAKGLPAELDTEATALTPVSVD
jgi:tRNA pseudouridine55 synthase